MTRTGIKIGLDVSELVSNAGRAAGAISKLTDAMAQAEREGRWDDIGKFAHEIERLQGRNVGFDKEFRNILAGPGTHGQSKGASVEIDSGYEEAVRSHMAAMNGLTAKYEKAIAKGDMTGLEKISSLLDTQYGELLNTFREARGLSRMSGSFSAKERPQTQEQPPRIEEPREAEPPPRIEQPREAEPPPRIEQPRTEPPPRIEPPREAEPHEQFPDQHKPNHVETHNPLGGIVSSAETLNEVIRSLDTRIAVARKDGEHSKVGELYYAREKLKTSAASLDRDTGNMMKDPKFLQMMDKKAEGRSLTQGEEKYFSRIDTLSDTLRKNTEALLEANRTGDTEELLRQSSQIGTNATDLRNTAGQRDDSLMGRGVQGGVMSLALGHISNAISSGLSRWTGSLDRSGIVAQYGSGDIRGAQLAERRRQDNLAGGAADTIAGMSNLLAFLGPKGILAAGAINLGASVFNSVRQGQTNLEATDIAKAELWQQRSGQAMELAALIGNPGAVRESFGIAADAAARFGFSAEEGMAAMNQAAQQGLDRAMAEVNARRVFDFERRTGADRGALSSLANMSARFNAGDALGDAWAGLNASGMSSGQFNEYLRAMQRVMEDGISRGFVRSSEDVAKNLTMLAQLTGGDNPLWQGEHGARRLSEMNAGLEAATALTSASDVIALRAARKIIGDDTSYIYAMKLMEEGVTPALFRNFMDLTSNAEGGAMEGIIERMRETLGLNYTNAYALFTGWRDNPQFMDDNYLERVLQRHGAILPSADSAEMEAARITSAITNWWTQNGMRYWDNTFLPALQREFRSLRGGEPSSPSHTNSLKVLEEMEREFVEALESGTAEEFREAANNHELARLAVGEETFNSSFNHMARMAEVDRMGRELIQTRRQEQRGGEAFFTGGGLFRNDDDRAKQRLLDFGRNHDPQARDAFNEVIAILSRFTPEQQQAVNETNAINYAITNVMTDTTGQQLLYAIRALAEKMDVNVTIED